MLHLDGPLPDPERAAASHRVFNHGSMANALAMAIGAQLSHPERQVVSVCGDGGLAMLLGELLTVKTHHLPVKVVVYNNASLDMVRLEMLVAGDPPFETEHDPVDYAAIAQQPDYLFTGWSNQVTSTRRRRRCSLTTGRHCSTW